MLTEDNDDAILDGLDFCFGDEPSVVAAAQFATCRWKEGMVKWRRPFLSAGSLKVRLTGLLMSCSSGTFLD